MSGKRPVPDGEESPTKNRRRVPVTNRSRRLQERNTRFNESTAPVSSTSTPTPAIIPSVVVSPKTVASPDTAITSPSPALTPTLLPLPNPKIAMAANPAAAADPKMFEDYYYGLRGNPRLLARSSAQPWTRPLANLEEYPYNIDPGYYGQHPQQQKRMSVVGRHALRKALDSGLREKILEVLATMNNPTRLISVDYIRLGYDWEDEKNNPVVVWVTVEENQVPEAEAQRIVDALAQECRGVDLPDVEVEMAEGRRSN